MRSGSKILCPVCSSDKLKFLYSVDSVSAANHVIGDSSDKPNELLKSIIEEIWDDSNCKFLKCEICSFSFASPFISGNTKFYSITYSDSLSFSPWKWEYQVTFDAIKELESNSSFDHSKLLEVGAGNGSFVKKISQEIIQAENILCTEFSEYGRKEIESLNIECLSIDVREISAAKYYEAFDIVCVFQVLEHLDRLNEFFEKINWLTTRNAYLFIAVPNSYYREFYDRLGSFFDVPPTHVSRWTKQSFCHIAKKFGWVLLKHAIQPVPYFTKLRKFLFNRLDYHFTIFGWINNIKNPLINRLFKFVAFSFISLIYFPRVVELSYCKMGISQWVCLKKLTL